VLGLNTAKVVQAVGDAGDEVLDQCPVAHAANPELEEHLVVKSLQFG